MPNTILAMPVFEIVPHDNVHNCCGTSCQFLHPDYCVLTDEYLDFDVDNDAYVRSSMCVSAEMQANNYQTFVPDKEN